MKKKNEKLTLKRETILRLSNLTIKGGYHYYKTVETGHTDPGFTESATVEICCA